MSRVAVVGASPKPERYSNRALRALSSLRHEPIPVSRSGQDILGLQGYATVGAIPAPVDTVTIYLSPERQEPIIRDLVLARPQRVIFNPGAENPAAYPALAAAGIEILEACTLVLLSTGQF